MIDFSFHHLFPKQLIEFSHHRYRLSPTSRKGWGKIKVRIVILKTFFQTSHGQGQVTDLDGFVFNVCVWVFTSNYPMRLMCPNGIPWGGGSHLCNRTKYDLTPTHIYRCPQPLGVMSELCLQLIWCMKDRENKLLVYSPHPLKKIWWV